MLKLAGSCSRRLQQLPPSHAPCPFALLLLVQHINKYVEREVSLVARSEPAEAWGATGASWPQVARLVPPGA